MILNKWNYVKHALEDYEVPDSWVCKYYSNDMEEIVNCPHCGKKLMYGNAYTSREIMTPRGFGYGVCPDCYEEELKRYR